MKNWTGERLETFIFNNTTIEHLHRYALAMNFVRGDKVILDIACGEGYGSYLMSKSAQRVIGVDIDKETIDKAIEKYKASNLEFKIGRADEIPIQDHTIDIIISFETIEHHDKQDEMMIEIKRVLKPGGLLIISSPNKKYYSDERRFVNKFHKKELYEAEFKNLIHAHFENTKFFYQNMFIGSLVVPELFGKGIKIFDGDFHKIINNSFKPMYIIAFASDKDIKDDIGFSGFNGEEIYYKERSLKEDQLRSSTREETKKWIEKSWNFRIGNFITKPIKTIFRK